MFCKVYTDLYKALVRESVQDKTLPVCEVNADGKGTQKLVAANILPEVAPIVPSSKPQSASAEPKKQRPSVVDFEASAQGEFGMFCNLEACKENLTIIVVGATGDLAHRKTFPALFSLYGAGFFPKSFAVVGYARSHMSIEEIKQRVADNLECRSALGSDVCGPAKGQFLKRVKYISGSYDDLDAFEKLNEVLTANEKATGMEVANRLYYFAIPPSVFLAAAKGIRAHGASKTGWTRLIVEKPFGRDRESSDELSNGLSELFPEEFIFRIDHYLGKEVVQNLMVMRFANVVYEPLWNKDVIASIQVIFREDLDLQGRGGYFDTFGIIRDVIQNHLLQVAALLTIEEPNSLGSEDVREQKVAVIQAMRAVTPENCVVGQFVAGNGKGGYLDDATVPRDSTTPTFASVVLFIDNPRWEGVPIILTAGKGLDRRNTECIIQFRERPKNIFAPLIKNKVAANELVIQVQPDEKITMWTLNKEPGLASNLVLTGADLDYKNKFVGKETPEAYERLILDAIHGNRSLFIRTDELQAAWDVFTPLLHYLDDHKVKPFSYPFGIEMPPEAIALGAKYGVRVPRNAP